MKNNNWVLWVKIVFMLVALAGIFSAMSYFRSGKAFKDPDSAAQIFLGQPPRSAKIVNDKLPTEPAPTKEAPASH